MEMTLIVFMVLAVAVVLAQELEKMVDQEETLIVQKMQIVDRIKHIILLIMEKMVCQVKAVE